MAAPYAESWRSRRKTPRSTSCSKSPRAGALALNHIVGDITTVTASHIPHHHRQRPSRQSPPSAADVSVGYRQRLLAFGPLVAKTLCPSGTQVLNPPRDRDATAEKSLGIS